MRVAFGPGRDRRGKLLHRGIRVPEPDMKPELPRTADRLRGLRPFRGNRKQHGVIARHRLDLAQARGRRRHHELRRMRPMEPRCRTHERPFQVPARNPARQQRRLRPQVAEVFQPRQHPVPAVRDEREQKPAARRCGETVRRLFQIRACAGIVLKIHPGKAVDLDVHQRRQQHREPGGRDATQGLERYDLPAGARQPHRLLRPVVNRINRVHAQRLQSVARELREKARIAAGGSVSGFLISGFRVDSRISRATQFSA